MSHLSLFELNELVKKTLSAQLEPTYWVVAEIGELRVHQKGHCYMELVDKEDDRLVAKMRATLWSYNYRRLGGWFRAITGEDLRAGMKVLCQVEVAFHELYGMSVNIRDIDANFTLGERARRRQEVIARLTEEGVLEMNKSLELPLVPQRIAVISSPTAAGLGDFMDQLGSNRYGYRFEVKLFKASMQGEQASQSIIEAMLQAYEEMESKSTSFDMLAIIRGGGAQVDLDCFDTYELASHIAQYPIPVITGIGHERDETVADLVAHTRMKTPTAVAEFLISGIVDFETRLLDQWQRLSGLSAHKLSEQKYRLDSMVNQIRYLAGGRLQHQQGQLGHWQQQLRYFSNQQLRRQREQLNASEIKLKSESRNQLQRSSEKLKSYEKFLRASDPEKIFRRGFSYTTVNGRPLHKADELKPGDLLETLTHSQVLKSRLETSENRKDHEQKK
ncbi:MAG: exodeoxyribonuclease VII large subunit [Cyclobacteriaceae bacterium]